MQDTSSKTRRKKIGEASEILDAIGHEDEKEGIKWTKYFMDLWDKQEWDKNQLKKEKLEKKRKFSKIDYFKALAGMLQQESFDMDIPDGYRVWSEFSGDGVVLKFTDIQGNIYYKAFKPDGTPEVDFNAVVGMLIDLQDSIDGLERLRMNQFKKDTGIILPDDKSKN